MGIRPFLSVEILRASLSTQITFLPISANHAPVTSPTYPVPIMHMFMGMRFLSWLRCPGPDRRGSSGQLLKVFDHGLPPGAEPRESVQVPDEIFQRRAARARGGGGEGLFRPLADGSSRLAGRVRYEAGEGVAVARALVGDMVGPVQAGLGEIGNGPGEVPGISGRVDEVGRGGHGFSRLRGAGH